MSDKIREIQSRLSKNAQGNNDSLAAVIAYVPLFGWVYPFLFKKENEFCQFHGKQGLHLNIGMVAVYFVVWIIENFPITAWLFRADAIFHPLTQTLWLVTAITYFALCGIGAYKAFSEEKWEVPYLSEFVEKIKKQLKDR